MTRRQRTNEQVKRMLLMHFATLGRDACVQRNAALFADVVRMQAETDGDYSDLIVADAANREISRLLEIEDKRYKKLLRSTEDDLLEAAKDNMIDFDRTQHVEAPSAAVLSRIDGTIHSVDKPEQYFALFQVMPFFKQTHVLEKLNVASGDHADVHGFTEALLALLRGSQAYEPSVHGKLQREFMRVRKPERPQGRPATIGNEMLIQLIAAITAEFMLPKSAAANVVQEIIPKVLDFVCGPDKKVVRSKFAPTDSAIRNILSKL